MTRAPLRVGIVGAGMVAGAIHAPGYVACADAELCAVTSARRSSAARLAEEHAVACVHDSPDDLFTDPDIDAVSICTPPSTHRALVEAAVAAGKHVLLEKPIATSLDDLDAIHHLAREADVVVDIVRNERFMEFNRQVRDAVAQGMIGEPLGILQTISTTGPEAWAPDSTWFRDGARAGGGALIDLAVHKADQAGWIAGRGLVERSIWLIAGGPAEVEEQGLLGFELEGGIHCAVHASWKGPADEASIVVTGSDGVLTGVWSSGEITCRGRVRADWSAPIPWGPEDHSGLATVADFVDNCLAGRRPIETDPAWDCGTRSVLLGYACAEANR